VSCDTSDGGCNGGNPVRAAQWVVSKNSGNAYTESSYAYTSGGGNSGKCITTGHTTGAGIASATGLSTNENTLASWVYSNGPASIFVDATSWQSYKSGIMSSCVAKGVDHCVLVVGYNSNYNPAYWIVKNSWSTGWGESGYIRLTMFHNTCLMATYPSSAKVK